MANREAVIEINQSKWYAAMKRVSGSLLSILGLIILSPLLLIVCIAIKLEDPKGPILFKQVRVGKDERQFEIYKFRTMRADAEEMLEELLKYNEIEGAMFKMKDDPRITKIGKFLRKTSIDELPQLWNVVKGDMALVGPRPPLPREVAEYSAHDKKRLTVTPGCTGLWQVSGRNDLDFHQMVELDLQYIREASLLFDFKIMVKTVGAMLAPKNAY
ncbi:sugar transferase [Listeria fleischmannii]|uniref:Sugar transferase n=1 Tax=Listeria fleischmannii TaxID=1069827 RepID=A0A841YHY5_9LIST|nr:sugar transferase [Listeria fleischmannii]MBC1399886.1 sugar transferase [Listeria fleischmannii]MBC1419436.1 sugar transferase [Listeria fleischmannii]MBC1428195.1 sugar transferase [Listeria fleischmannii]STY34558.1 Putative colanic biosynthesis UDP-glucose lipid carrier transferase [Listeria fleischmannii subsp. coloradonensis]